MVYIYSILYRLVLYPLLIFSGTKVLGPKTVRLIRSILFIEFGLALLGVLLHRHIQHPLMSLYMSAGLFIFFSLGYASAFALGMNGLRLLDNRHLGWYSSLGARGKRIGQGATLALSAIIFVLCLYSGYHNVRYPEVVHERLFIERLTPQGVAAEHRLRLALLTDLHIGEGITPDYVERAVELILAEQPDLILVGGDYIDHDIIYAREDRIQSAMRRLTAPHGTYYVLGNHEYRSDTLANMSWVAEVGGTLLIDSVAYPADSLIALVGRDDYVNLSRRALHELTAELDQARPIILLEHTPQGIDSLQNNPIDLALYGHTHGGQLWPMHALIWLKYGIIEGRKEQGQTTIHVSSGIGAAGAPYRIGTRSQIVIYDLYW
ncbi:MAG: metallophosphoesterase [Porphyromonadaceae bacterium]|nr:metallophosphoesterase [Porphyromonadaceae bacterium]